MKSKVISKLPQTPESIFSIMSTMARDYKAINLSQGFPNFPVDPVLIDLVTKAMREGFNQYAPMAGLPQLLEAIATKLKVLYNRKVNPQREITITSGATQAIYTIISAMVHPGDEVVIIEPAYDCYAPAITINGGKSVPYRLNKPNYSICWPELRALINDKTKMIILNTPHNPTGQVLKREDWDELSRIMIDFPKLFLLSDEVYEHIIFDGYSHESALVFDSLWDRMFAVYSFGKTFHATGWKMGYVIAPDYLTIEFRKVHQFNVFSSNTPMQHALAEYIDDERNYKNVAPFYQKKRDLIVEMLVESPLRTLNCHGTYFILLDFSDFSDKSDVEFANWLTQEIGVAVIPPSVFYSDGLDESVVRLCFAKTDDLLTEAGRRLAQL